MVAGMFAGVTFLADNDFGDDLGDGVAGPIGLLIIVLLVIATVLLIRNMNARLRRLPDRFPDPVDPRQASTGEGDDDDASEAEGGNDVTADAAASPSEGQGESPGPAATSADVSSHRD